MDILLIDPPYRALKGIAPECAYSLALTCLAAYLKREGFTAGIVSGDILLENPKSSFLNFNVRRYALGQKDYCEILADDNHIVWRKISAIIKENNPLAVGISYLTPHKEVVGKIAALTKGIDSKIKVVAGGHHPTYAPLEVMEDANIDFAIRGEGEMPLSQLLKELKKAAPDLSRVQGVSWRDPKGEVVSNPDAGQIQDLDTLPFPAREAVIGADWKRHSYHMVLTARGCPYNCSFCADKNLWRGKVRRRSAENVITELKELKKAYPNIQTVDFTDGTFTFNRAFTEDFCRKMREEKINLKWRCTARYDNNLDSRILSLMKEAGCFALYLGVESGSERILEMIDKNISAADIIEKDRLIYQSGIISMASIMIGLPGETNEDIEQTLSLMRELKVDLFDVNSYVPLAGTPLYERLNQPEKKNIDWLKTSFKSLDNYFNEAISPPELKNALFSAYDIAERKKRQFIRRILWKSIVRMFSFRKK